MKILRTPERYFSGIKDYPFKPHYTNIETSDGSQLRIHHIDEGPIDAPVIIFMHGQPVWSYLYSRMIPYFVGSGVRVIAPDLPGYGKSDKPSSREDYSYQNQVDWMGFWLKKNDFRELTLFGQDWGGLIGLRMISEQPERFKKVAVGNTGLPYAPDVPNDVVDQVKDFMASGVRLTPMAMAVQIRAMGKGVGHAALKFMYWQKFCWDTENLPVGIICSMMMEKRPRYLVALDYLAHQLRIGPFSPFSSHLAKAFEAPFPSPHYKMGPRAMPSHVPIIPDQSLEAQRKARDFFRGWTKPFLSVFAGNDPVTNRMEADVLEMVPSAISAPHIGGGHFFQWTRPKELSRLLIDFVKGV